MGNSKKKMVAEALGDGIRNSEKDDIQNLRLSGGTL